MNSHVPQKYKKRRYKRLKQKVNDWDQETLPCKTEYDNFFECVANVDEDEWMDECKFQLKTAEDCMENIHYNGVKRKSINKISVTNTLTSKMLKLGINTVALTHVLPK
eukprot:TRINITY_DN14615_c0_g1_i1.p1 TRINITY_DN14615_c0_g1~~TRINITY_DN14615_c0_g1_i1.p1  ORF type:complete len:108 (-),score=6.97 TRINITY_DN14615_c0_g1_i1:25-348(-)